MPKPFRAVNLLLAAALGLGLAAFAQGPGDALAQAADVGTQTYVVKHGDTISSIARTFYGKSSLGGALWRANRQLVAHPRRLTAGDTIYIFPESTLRLRTEVQVPPPPMQDPDNLYQRDQPLDVAFPEYFSYVADPRGQGGTGATRVHIRRQDPRSCRQKDPKKDPYGAMKDPATYEKRDPASGDTNPATGKKDPRTQATTVCQMIDQVYEVHMVGEIIASSDRGAPVPGRSGDMTASGRMLLSTGDNVVVRFTEDVARLRDSDTYEDPDPYFTTFPVYSVDFAVRETDRLRPDTGANLGQIFHYKGKVHIVARVEGLVPPTASASSKANRGRGNSPSLAQDLDPVSYVARITYSEDAIQLNDKVMLFIPTDRGAERHLDPPYVEDPGTYASPGK
ncbi:MAG: LysM peptidoglycan-binding domain-containing protein [Deltaproteobacteria bacterium]|jgi:hypothetical protein|nr:LysM peptidoglycan-binding domain-containing protein [Deltaproteobacteria bacterium]